MPIYRLFRAAGAVALVALGAAACGGAGSLPPIAPMATDSTPGARTLRPGDVIKIQVFGHDELSGDFTVDENADLLLPIVGEFSVRDMSVTDLRARIRREFGQLYTQSFVSVVPMFRVSVLGEVMHPGLYSVDPTLNIYEVLATAGGTTRNANERGMRLIRGGQQVAAPVTASALAHATLREIGIRSGDQIIVPRKTVTYETWLVGLQVLNLVLLSYSIFRK
jgi:polysaccharide export outer membrane protein